MKGRNHNRKGVLIYTSSNAEQLESIKVASVPPLPRQKKRKKKEFNDIQSLLTPQMEERNHNRKSLLTYIQGDAEKSLIETQFSSLKKRNKKRP